MTPLDEPEITVLTMGAQTVLEGSHNVINDYVLAKSQEPGDEGHWAYAPFSDFNPFSRDIIGNSGENKVNDTNYSLQLGLTTLYIECYDKLKKCIREILEKRASSVEQGDEQDKQLLEARENIRVETAAIHTAWNIQGVLHMWRSHCQSPKYYGRFGKPFYKEILCAWKSVRDELGEEDAVGVAWLDSWVKRFNEFYHQKDDWRQKTLSWNMIHDVGDADFGHQSIRLWQVEINKFRYRHRSILSISQTIAGVKERMSQFRLMIKDPDSYHGWSAGDWYWQVKTEEFRTLANQLMDLEFRHRLQEHPAAQLKFSELDRLALIVFKDQMIEDFNSGTYSTVRADLMIETWYATFGLLLNYDMICTGYAWSVIKSTSQMDTDCFIINYQDTGSKKGGWQCPVTMEKIGNFLTGLQSFIRRRAESLRKRNKKTVSKTLHDGIAGSEPKSKDGVLPDSILHTKLVPAATRQTAGTEQNRQALSGNRNIQPMHISTERDHTNQRPLELFREPSANTEEPLVQASYQHNESKQDILPDAEELNIVVKDKPANTPSIFSAPGPESSKFDWFEDVNEQPPSPNLAPIASHSPLTDGMAKLNFAQDQPIVARSPPDAKETSKHASTLTAELKTRHGSLKDEGRPQGILRASVKKPKTKKKSTGASAAPRSPDLSKTKDTASVPTSKLTKTLQNKNDFIGYIEPSSGPWIEVTKKKKPAAKQSEPKQTTRPDNRLESRGGQGKTGDSKISSLLQHKGSQMETAIVDTVRQQPQTEAIAADEVPQEPHNGPKCPVTEAVELSGADIPVTQRVPDILKCQSNSGEFFVSMKSKLMAANMTKHGRAGTVGDISNPQKGANRQGYDLRPSSEIGEHQVRPEKTVTLQPDMNSDDITEHGMDLLAIVTGQVPIHLISGTEFDPEFQLRTGLDSCNDFTLESQPAIPDVVNDQKAGSMSEKLAEGTEGLSKDICMSGVATQGKCQERECQPQHGSFDEESQLHHPGSPYSVLPLSLPSPDSSIRQSTQIDDGLGGKLHPEEVDVFAKMKLTNTELPDGGKPDDDDFCEERGMTEVSSFPEQKPEQEDGCNEDQSKDPQIQDELKDGRDITALISRFKKSLIPGPTLEDLVKMQGTDQPAKAVNSITHDSGRNVYHKQTSSLDDGVPGGYIGFAMLAKGMEETVYNMLEKWYDHKE